MPYSPEKSLSPYEEQALVQIRLWKHPEPSPFDQINKTVSAPFNWASDMLLNSPGVGKAIKQAIEETVTAANDFSQNTVPKDKIYEKFRDYGHEHVHGGSDLMTLDLQELDIVVDGLDWFWKAAAGAGGALTGVMGIAGLLLDIPSLVSLNLRAIGEYATYYGFDVDSQHERLFAMTVLGYSSGDDTMKALTMSQLSELSQKIAKRTTLTEVEKKAFAQVVKQLAISIGTRLTRTKIAQMVPLAGAAIGGGVNGWFTSRVCEAAFNLYRERFLLEKYGVHVIDI